MDVKPYLKNWHAVRKSLGLVLANTFFIADRTLLVEGESEAFYIGAVLSALDRAGLIDVDLNMFSVTWAGNCRDFAPLARLLAEEGREVVALVDGDKGGKDLRRGIDALNKSAANGTTTFSKVLAVVELDRNKSIEDVLLVPEQYLEAVASAAEELVKGGYKQPGKECPKSREEMLKELSTNSGELTRGKHVESITSRWFDGDPISKLAIARHYVTWLDEQDVRGVVKAVPTAIQSIIDRLGLSSKSAERDLFEQSQDTNHLSAAKAAAAV